MYKCACVRMDVMRHACVLTHTHTYMHACIHKYAQVIRQVLLGASRTWVVQVKRHDDAVEEDNSEELTKEEQEQADREEAEDEALSRARPQQLQQPAHAMPHAVSRKGESANPLAGAMAQVLSHFDKIHSAAANATPLPPPPPLLPPGDA